MRGSRPLVPVVLVAVLLGVLVGTAGCATATATGPSSTAPSPTVASTTAAGTSAGSATGSPSGASGRPGSQSPGTQSPGTQSPGNQSPGTTSRTAGPLARAVVVLDPGHDGGNAGAPSVINRLVDIGTGRKACDTAGTETDAGYPEHAFTWDLASRLAALLRAAGARVVLTRDDDTGVGPCVTQRAEIGNRAARDAAPGSAVVALSLHADGGPPGGVGFHVIEPLPVAGNAAIVEPSRRLGAAVREAFRRGTGEPLSTYTGTDGITRRKDLGGLNLSRVPKVFLECGNMRNARDAARLADPAWRERAAAALLQGLQQYLETHG